LELFNKANIKKNCRQTYNLICNFSFHRDIGSWFWSYVVYFRIKEIGNRRQIMKVNFLTIVRKNYICKYREEQSLCCEIGIRKIICDQYELSKCVCMQELVYAYIYILSFVIRDLKQFTPYQWTHLVNKFCFLKIIF
jgi:hypothetical protein